MPDSLKDRLKTDLQTIKAEGGNRTTRIREIIQTAATQSMSELKEGVGEMRSTASQTISTVAQTLSDAEPSASSDAPSVSTVLNGIRSRIVNQWRSQLVHLDATLTTHYGDRYAMVKQRLRLFRTWYDNSKANAEAIGVDLVQQKQTAIELKIADQGALVARKEQQIRQQVKEYLNAVVSKK
ncbi:MAG: hypothetical protein MUC48_08835 [Leptolyngbya sp. Prado105]|jgi:hypothetical protein|nr:hypothetical protein [Leptolyngbya sp. Prado105]